MKYLLTALLPFGFMATSAQRKIDGHWEGFAESSMNRWKLIIHLML